MPTAKLVVTIDAQLLREVDRWVAAGEFPSRSRAVQTALKRLQEEHAKRQSLLHELSKLNPLEERALAEEGLVGEAAWRES